MAGRIAYYGGIVRDGLVLDLDAAKKDSYPGTGTTWSDVSGNGNTGTLVNGPTFDSQNGGSIVFDGSTDYGLINYGFSGYEGTFSTWVKTSNTSNYLFIVNKGTLTATPNTTNGLTIITPTYATGSTIVYVNNSTGTTKNSLTNSSPVNIRDNKWHNICVTVRYLGGNTTLSTYMDGTLSATQARAGDYFDFFNLTTPYYLASLNATTIRSQINLATHQIYNRALSAQEVLQNYNATKGRYGL